ncbi:MAG: YmdB family metallophosphoesterase [Alphaproteobacteria bacterium]|nr:YmdB family metallophosphoesterase [Alphaproteobacteria bacterium]
MKILFLGDVFGRSGRVAVRRYLPQLRAEYAPEVVIINAENSNHGFGVSEKTATELFGYGVDVLTGGNHSWDCSDIIPFIQRNPNLIRPANTVGNNVPGAGSYLHETADGKRVLVVNILCRLFMNDVENPFKTLDELLAEGAPGLAGLDAVVVDCHGEANSEKRALGHFVDGRVSLIVGTHTHVPTSDAHIMPAGSGYMSDAGMCGDYNSVIGIDKEISLDRFLGRIPRPRMRPAEGEGGVSGVLIETNPTSGLCQNITAVHRGCPWSAS